MISQRHFWKQNKTKHLFVFVDNSVSFSWTIIYNNPRIQIPITFMLYDVWSMGEQVPLLLLFIPLSNIPPEWINK